MFGPGGRVRQAGRGRSTLVDGPAERQHRARRVLGKEDMGIVRAESSVA
jgi:hypothetical protein